MAMEVHVFFRGKVPSVAALARALKELGFPFSIPGIKGSLAQRGGFLSMKLRREETGVEVDLYDHAAVTEFSTYGVDQSYQNMASFRWSGSMEEAAAGLCCAAALAKLTDGVVFDEAEGKLLSVPQAIDAARQFIENLPKPNARYGTRPADIKRYLKPLLEMRSDLVLRGRYLIIRPVRHILRGAFFDRTSDKYTFRIWRYIEPLYSASWNTVGLGDYINSVRYQVWQPLFEPILLDTLAEDIFDHVGSITSFSDLARDLEGTNQFYRARVRALVLAGERDRACNYVAALERSTSSDGYWRKYVEEIRTFVDRDLNSVCREYHDREIQRAETLHLRDIWEQTSFPAELPHAERIQKSSEVAFAMTPWVARLPRLIQEVPDGSGDVRFGRLAHRRKDRIILLMPLKREEAAAMHEKREDYVLSARLPRGQLLVLKHVTGWSPHDPEQPSNPSHVPCLTIYLTIQGSSHFVHAWSSESLDHRNTLNLHSIEVRNHQRHIWSCWYDLGEGTKSVRDHRIGPQHYAKSALSQEQRNLIGGPLPEFGDFERPLRQVLTLLQLDGFGRIE